MKTRVVTLSMVVMTLTGCAYEEAGGLSGELDVPTAEAGLGASDSTERFIVSFRNPGEGKNALRASGAEVLLELGPQNAVAARIPARALEGLRRNPNIELIEQDSVRTPLAQSTPYGIGMVQANLVWPTTTGANRKVCIIDSGLHVSHEDIQKTGVTGYPAGWNTDGCGHGTHVAGTIAALNNTSGVVGVIPSGGVALHIVKVFNDSCGWAYASALLDGLNRCVSAGANVVNMSLGGPTLNRTEERAFNDAYTKKGVLLVAAAGNDGSTRKFYPASYAGVISVAAIDANKTVASFSQKNASVSLAAPGVSVLSTLSYHETNSFTVDGSKVDGAWVEFTARSAGVTGVLANGGLCTSTGAWAGKIVLCERGTNTYLDKANFVKAGGGAGIIIYNNVEGPLYATLGSGASSPFPGIGITQADGRALLAKVGLSGTLASSLTKPASGYEAWDGTSMASPHVAGVAALIWSANPAWTNAQVRGALESTAEDLGTAGKDNAYGYGLVRAKAALDFLRAGQ